MHSSDFILSPENELFVYKATFRNNVKNYQHIYKKKEVILLISPLQPYYNNKDKFKAIIQLINHSQFKKCHIIIGDTNYQHTFRINTSDPNEAYTLAEKIGSLWINENRNLFSTLKLPYTLTRWDEWVNHERYKYHRTKLDELYNSDLAFEDSFTKTAIEFVNRNHDRLNINSTNYEHAIACCLEYLKEECAIIMPLWAELGYQFIIYPTKMLMAMEETYQKLIVPYYSTLPHWLTLRFSTLSKLSDHV